MILNFLNLVIIYEFLDKKNKSFEIIPMKHLVRSTHHHPLRVVRFGNCYINITERKIFKGKTLLKISSKTFDVLLMLVNNAGEIISKDEMLNQIWENSFVEESNLAVHISKIRKLLYTSKNKTYIETVSGIGYRFNSKVYSVDENEWEKLISDKDSSINIHLAANTDSISIAVFPLQNENGDEEIDYLADGITESIINNLSSVSGIKVLARNTVFRYKNKDFNIQQTGKEVGVEKLLTGRIRVVGDNLIIGVELINVDDRTQIWGIQLNRTLDNILEIQKNVSQEITENLKNQLLDNDKENL